MTTDFNPEKEPTPERKWWSIFERQSEFEQPHEEKRIERAKGLKTATKERGHFWESFMPRREENEDSAEIAPKGEKVRKKWRALLRRKSETQIEEFQEKDPDTVDSYWLAQLMIAERILTLNEHLPQTEPKSWQRKETKTELDVLGLLSEKLSDPKINVPDEIEQTYQTIIKVMEAGDTVIETDHIPQIEETTEKETDTPEQTRSLSFQRYGMAVIVALKGAITKNDTAEEPIPAENISTPAQKHSGIGIRPVTSAPSVAPRHSLDHPNVVLPHDTPNILPRVALTAAVITAEKEFQAGAISSVRTAPETPIPPLRQTTQQKPRFTPLALPHSSEIHHIIESPHVPHNSAEEVAKYMPKKKFEHMSTTELLQIAQTISIGHGEYLGRAYESGKIDRDGLIRVLKTAGRSGNYREEYRRSSAEYLRLRMHSSTFAASQSQRSITPGAHLPTPKTLQSQAIRTTKHEQPSNKPVKQTSITQTKPLFSLKTITILCLVILALTLLVLL